MKFRKRFRYNKKRVFIYLFFIMLLSALTLGYSLLSTTLQIEGVGKIAKAAWNVHFDNIETTAESIKPTEEPIISNDTKITFNLDLNEHGEFYEFTADIVNEGTMDAKINSLNILPVLTDEQKKYFKYTVTYADHLETEIKIGDALDAGTTEKIKVRFEYLEQEDTTLYPTEDQELIFEVDMDYVQGKGNKVPHPITKYRTLPATYVYIGDNVSEGVTLFDSVAEAKSAFAGKPFYLKHTIANDIVKESYVCFEKNDSTYCLQGLKTQDMDTGEYVPEYYDSATGNIINPYYESNKEILIRAFGKSYCTVGDSDIYCDSTGGRSASAYVAGDVSVSSNVSECYINSNGISYCYNFY